MVDIVVPSPGESITEVTLGQWHKQDGDWVETDEVLVDIESDKATLEVRAPAAGVPGRWEYLKLNAWAKPTRRTRSIVASKSASVSPGWPTMKSDDSARSARASRSRSTRRR